MSRRKEFKTWSAPILVALLLPGLTGCLTSKLWDGDFNSYRQYWAATNSPPVLFHTVDGKDVLVCYLECNGKNANTKERAYLLYQNRRQVDENRSPIFVNPTEAEKRWLIPLTRGTNSPGGANDDWLRAVLDKDGRHFTIVSKGREVGAFALPVYAKDDKAFKRALLTPLAVTGDTVIVAVAVGSVVGLIWWAFDAGPSGKVIDSHWKP